MRWSDSPGGRVYPLQRAGGTYRGRTARAGPGQAVSLVGQGGLLPDDTRHALEAELAAPSMPGFTWFDISASENARVLTDARW